MLHQISQRGWLNKRTREVQRVLVGIDPGFDHNLGRVSRREQLVAMLVTSQRRFRVSPAQSQSILRATPIRRPSMRTWINFCFPHAGVACLFSLKNYFFCATDLI
ncbi:MAG: hypothetical protein V7629_13300 [Motiliproteus sp.]